MGRYISTTGTASVVTREVATTYNAVVNDRILANTTSAAFTITLPLNSTLLVGDQIQVIDATGTFATNACTLARNSSLIGGNAEDLVLDVVGAVVTLLYTGPTYGWIITSN